MIQFDFKIPQSETGVIKATVRNNGVLGFSSGASKALGLNEESCFKLATNAEDKTDESLYLIPASADQDKVFQLRKAGDYYYLRIKHVLDEMGIDYRNVRIIYDIVTKEEDGIKYYKLIRRPIKKRS